jgi:hypothetical protein
MDEFESEFASSEPMIGEAENLKILASQFDRIQEMSTDVDRLIGSLGEAIQEAGESIPFNVQALGHIKAMQMRPWFDGEKELMLAVLITKLTEALAK